MNLGMAVVTGGSNINRAGSHDLLMLESAIIKTGIFVAVLEKSAAAATAVVIRSVRNHIDNVFFTHYGFDDKAELFGQRVTETFPHMITGVLYGKLHFQIFVPV